MKVIEEHGKGEHLMREHLISYEVTGKKKDYEVFISINKAENTIASVAYVGLL